MSEQDGDTENAGTDAADAAAALEASFHQSWDGEIERLRQMFVNERYGCWCGPGNICNEETDGIDTCCHQHDLGYDAVGVNSLDPAPAGQVNMWTIEGVKRTVEADAALVACTMATEFDDHFYGPEAAVYRAAMQLICAGRAAVAAWLISNGM